MYFCSLKIIEGQITEYTPDFFNFFAVFDCQNPVVPNSVYQNVPLDSQIKLTEGSMQTEQVGLKAFALRK